MNSTGVNPYDLLIIIPNKKQDQLQVKIIRRINRNSNEITSQIIQHFVFANGAATFVIIALVFICELVNFWLKKVLNVAVVQNIDINNYGCELLCEKLK
jgi:ABC-type multidrug transport system permease subunit